jgi:hypothetical protein
MHWIIFVFPRYQYEFHLQWRIFHAVRYNVIVNYVFRNPLPPVHVFYRRFFIPLSLNIVRPTHCACWPSAMNSAATCTVRRGASHAVRCRNDVFCRCVLNWIENCVRLLGDSPQNSGMKAVFVTRSVFTCTEPVFLLCLWNYTFIIVLCEKCLCRENTGTQWVQI